MVGINKVTLLGNVGKAPIIRYTQDGNPIATFSLATAESYKDKTTGEYKTITEWHRIVVFNKNIATFVEKHVKQGSRLYIEGSLKTRKYQQDNVEKTIIEVVLNNFKGELQLLDIKQQNNEEPPIPEEANYTTKNTNNSNQYQDNDVDINDDIPF